MKTDSRPNFGQQDAELAVNLIAEQIGNIEAAIFTMDEALTSTQQRKLHFLMFQQVFRMCFSWLILTAAKVEELWRIYGTLATPYAKEEMRAALREISARGLTDMRNSAVAHVLDRDTRKPVTPEQIQEMVTSVSGGDLLSFIHWLRHPDDPKVETLSRALRVFRSDIMKLFPGVRITMPVSTYATANGNVEF